MKLLTHSALAALSLVLLLSVFPREARAADPSQRWRTIKTPHFYVHYYVNSRHDVGQAAQQVARAAETAHARLAPTLRHVPAVRTHVVVTDDTDGPNGSAQIVPLNVVRVFLTAPGSLNTLNDYDDWIYGLIVHEYAHILHIDTIHNLARVINIVLGKTWAPNQIQPRWFIEGLATYFESERTSGGRGRGSIFDMYLRMAVLEGKILEIDQITSNTRYFPRGNVPYLYGARFIKYIADRFGEEKLAELSHRYGGTVIPYAINRLAREVLGHTYLELYADFKRDMGRRYALQRDAAAARGLTRFRKITDHGETSATPAYSTDGRELIFIDTDGHEQVALKVMDVASGRIREKYDVFGGSGIALTPDAQHIVYGEASFWRTFYSYDDLFVRHRRSGRVRRLTSGLRAREPAVSPDGNQVAFVTNDLGTNDLALIPFAGGAHRVLIKGREGDQFFTPRWSPDGERLVYSRWKRGGDRDLYLIEVRTGKIRQLTADRALDTDPVFGPDGQRLYFSSDRTGIFNVFCYDLRRGELAQVSNVLGGAFSPAVSPDERVLTYVGFSARGYDLHAMTLDRARFLPALPYVHDRPDPPPMVTTRDYPEGPYSPLPTLYPRAWSFRFGTDVYGSTIGLEVGGMDVVGWHRWALLANFSTARAANASYALSYAYSRLWPTFILDTSRFQGARGGAAVDGAKRNYLEENYGLGIVAALPVLRLANHGGDISLGYRFNWFRNAEEERLVVLPGMISPRRPEVGILSGLTLGLGYGSVQRYTWSVSSAKGRLLNLSLRLDHPSLGSDFKSTQLTWSWTEFLPLPWAHDHVVALRLAGGVAGGNLTRRGLFFIGGFPEQDILRSFFESTRVAGAFLRGYPPGVVHGNQYHLLNVEYRLPLLDIEKGLSSLPLYFSHIHAAAFVDVGNAFFDELKPEELKVGVGAEILLEVVIGYFLGTTLRVGYARGLMEKGGNQYHILLGYPL